MGVPRQELLSRMNSREYTGWMAYDRLDPVGSLGDWFRAANIMAAIVASATGRRVRVADFIPRSVYRRNRQTTREQLALWQRLAEQFNAPEQTNGDGGDTGRQHQR